MHNEDNEHQQIKSSVGGWRIGKGVNSHGYDLLKDLVGKHSFFEVLILHATGRLPENNFHIFVENVHLAMSYPDHRIWCNRIASLGATSGLEPCSSTLLGTMAQDSTGYGVGTLTACGQFLIKINEGLSHRTLKDLLETEIKKTRGKPKIIGYSRPIANGDERIAALKQVAVEQSLKTGKYEKLAFDIDHYLTGNYNESINFSAYVSAVMLDNGYTCDEIERIYTFVVALGALACYRDYSSQDSLAFKPLKITDLEYTGKQPRRLDD